MSSQASQLPHLTEFAMAIASGIKKATGPWAAVAFMLVEKALIALPPPGSH
jgi:hypothetical protein